MTGPDRGRSHCSAVTSSIFHLPIVVLGSRTTADVPISGSTVWNLVVNKASDEVYGKCLRYQISFGIMTGNGTC